MPPVFHSERYNVSLQNADTLEYSPVTVEVGVDGMRVHESNGSRVLSIYHMKDIARWSLSDDVLTIYVKSKNDVEERQVQFRGREQDVSSLLDALTCAAHQMLELIESKKAEATQSILKDSSRRKSKNEKQSVDDVEFWRTPEKEGWMYSQGEVIKTWRRRWFVLKSGFLFRFLTSEIDSTSKPRGIVDLSTITDITEGSSVTGKKNSINLSTATGHVSYCTDSELEAAEWMSALDVVHKRIVRRAAGIEDEDEEVKPKSKSRVTFADDSTSGRGNRSRSDSDFVSVIGYDNFSSASAPPDTSLNQSRIRYNDIDGISGVVNGVENDRMIRVNYGGSGFTPTQNMMQRPIQTPSMSAYQRTMVYPRQPEAPYGANYASTPAPQQQYPPSFLDQTPHQTPTYPAFTSINAPNYRLQVSL